ncbi:tyrosine/serine/threonine protein phosphatase [Castilleja foliolosa]|uniref:Tyrosine/serine/threonine protein phosphatase n=1 Tax=Castilleja foliolosa TaxID=1961234 RepID=A0ABD3ES09_9LAMI
MALSLAACIYFLNDKNKSLPRAAIIGFGALVVGWICGSLLVPIIPSFLLQTSGTETVGVGWSAEEQTWWPATAATSGGVCG